jgi:hypothetical protein
VGLLTSQQRVLAEIGIDPSDGEKIAQPNQSAVVPTADCETKPHSPDSKLLDTSILQGLQCESDGRILDVKGIAIGQLVEGDAELIASQAFLCNADGIFTNDEFKVVGRAEVIQLAKSELEEYSAFKKVEDCEKPDKSSHAVTISSVEAAEETLPSAMEKEGTLEGTVHGTEPEVEIGQEAPAQRNNLLPSVGQDVAKDHMGADDFPPGNEGKHQATTALPLSGTNTFSTSSTATMGQGSLQTKPSSLLDACRKFLSRFQTSSPTSNTTSTATSTSGKSTTSIDYFVFLTAGVGDEFALSQIEVTDLQDDKFYAQLAQEYRRLKGAFRRYLSIWKYSHCEFARVGLLSCCQNYYWHLLSVALRSLKRS